MLLIGRTALGQELHPAHEFNTFAGIRYLHYPICLDCQFALSEWNIPDNSFAAYGGAMMRRSRGLTLQLEIGYFKRQYYSTGVLQSENSAQYTERLFYARNKYINLAIGHTFGSGKTRFSMMAGIDFINERTHKQRIKSSGFSNMPSADHNNYPSVTPSGVSYSESNYNMPGKLNRLIIPLYCSTFQIAISKNIFLFLTHELHIWKRSLDDHVSDKVKFGAYRVAISYRIAAIPKKLKTQ